MVSVRSRVTKSGQEPTFGETNPRLSAPAHIARKAGFLIVCVPWMLLDRELRPSQNGETHSTETRISSHRHALMR